MEKYLYSIELNQTLLKTKVYYFFPNATITVVLIDYLSTLAKNFNYTENDLRFLLQSYKKQNIHILSYCKAEAQKFDLNFYPNKVNFNNLRILNKYPIEYDILFIGSCSSIKRFKKKKSIKFY